MSPQNVKTNLPIIQAYAYGKTIQYWDNEKWVDYTGNFPDFSIGRERRIKPEPKFREWAIRDVPMPCMIREKSYGEHSYPSVVLDCEACGISHVWDRNLRFRSYADLLTDWECTTDGGKTWKPCGIEITGEVVS